MQYFFQIFIINNFFIFHHFIFSCFENQLEQVFCVHEREIFLCDNFLSIYLNRAVFKKFESELKIRNVHNNSINIYRII